MRPKDLCSLSDYIIVALLMVFFTSIEPTKHYEEAHRHNVPWEEVVQVILTTKNPRKNGDTFEIENEQYYVVFTINDKTLKVINAKRK